MKQKQRMFTSGERSAAIRNSYLILPFSGVWTWLTGNDIAQRPPLWRSSSIESMAWALLWTLAGSTMTTLACFSSLSFPLRTVLYAIGVLFAASGARYVVATIIHMAYTDTCLKAG